MTIDTIANGDDHLTDRAATVPGGSSGHLLEADIERHALALGLDAAAIAACLEEAQDDATRQLIACLVREGFLDLEADAGAHLVTADEQSGRFSALLPRSGHRLSFQGRRLMLGRVTIESRIEVSAASGTVALTPALAAELFLSEFATGEDDWRGLLHDLDDSAGRGFLLRVLRHARRGAVAVDWARIEMLSADDQVVAAEQWAINGHFLHPCPKARVGLSLADEIAHAPEAGAAYRLCLASLASDRLASFDAEPGANSGCWMDQPSPAALDAAGFGSAGRADVLPVHPLQAARLGLAEAGHGLRLLDAPGPIARPLTAYRTVYLPEARLYLKLPLRIRITSATRTLSIKSRQNSIAVTRLLDRARQHRILPDTFKFLREVSSVGAAGADTLVKDAGFVARESCACHVAPGDWIIPALCLFETSPVMASRTVLDEILATYVGGAPTPEAAMRFLAIYAALYVEPCLTLLATAGVGLEAHLENSLMVFRGGVPIAAIYRDNDAVSICTPRLATWHQPAIGWFHPGSWNVAHDPFDAQAKVQHSLLHAHLGELIKTMTTNYGCSEAALWRVIRTVMDDAWSALERAPQTRRAAAQDRAFFNRPTVELKSLTRMRLANVKNRYIYTLAVNPLAAAKDQP